jgi:hypothetical protein
VRVAGRAARARVAFRPWHDETSRTPAHSRQQHTCDDVFATGVMAIGGADDVGGAVASLG